MLFLNCTESMDYYGDQEDVALFKMEFISYDNINSLVEGQEMEETPFNSIISDIIIVNEKQ